MAAKHLWVYTGTDGVERVLFAPCLDEAERCIVADEIERGSDPIAARNLAARSVRLGSDVAQARSEGLA